MKISKNSARGLVVAMVLGIAAMAPGIYGAFVSRLFAQGNQSGASVEGIPVNRSTVNGSITITTGNTFQTVLASNLTTQFGQTVTPRYALTIENNNASDSCWLYLGNGIATKAISILLLPGGSYTRYWPFVPSDQIQATCSTTSDTLYVDTQ